MLAGLLPAAHEPPLRGKGGGPGSMWDCDGLDDIDGKSKQSFKTASGMLLKVDR